MALGKNSVFCRFAADILGNMKKLWLTHLVKRVKY